MRFPVFSPPHQIVWGAAILSGALIGLSFPPYNQSQFIWVCLIPLLLGLHLSPRLTVREGLGGGYLLGLVYFSAEFWWLGLVTIPGALALVLYIAFYPALWLGWVAYRWNRTLPYRSGPTLQLAAELASLWVVLEWIRSWLFSGIGWNTLGVALHANLPLIQSVRYGGVFFLSWLIVLLNVIGALTLIRLWHEIRGEQPKRAHVDFSLGLLLVAVVFAEGFQHVLRQRPPTHHLRVGLVQPDIAQSEEHPVPLAEILETHVRLSLEANLLKPDMLLWSETPVGFGVKSRPEYERAVRYVIHKTGVPLLMGSIDVDKGEFYNSAFLFRADFEPPEIYHKNRLVLFGEYVPLAETFPWIEKLMPFSSGFRPGDHPTLYRLDAQSGLTLAPLICYEDTLPDYVRKVIGFEADLGSPQILINLTNDGWFQDSVGAELHLLNAQFRAVETGRPLLRCANTGISALIDSVGRVSRIFGLNEEGVRLVEVGWSEPQETFYLKWGDWIVGVSGIIILGSLLLSGYRKKNV